MDGGHVVRSGSGSRSCFGEITGAACGAYWCCCGCIGLKIGSRAIVDAEAVHGLRDSDSSEEIDYVMVSLSDHSRQ